MMATRKELLLNRLMRNKIETIKCKILSIVFVVAISSVLFFGCAPIVVPLSSTLDIEEPPGKREIKRVVVVIDKETAEMSQKCKPNALADTFQLDIGESIKSNALHVVKLNFTDVEFCNTITEVQSPFDYLLELKLIESNFVMGKTIFSTQKCFLKLDYCFYDLNKQPLFTVNSMSNGEAKATSKEVKRQIAFLGGGQVGFKMAMGRAWDIAIKDSLNQFLIQLHEYLEQK